MALNILCPLMESWDLGQWSLRQQFGENAAYFAAFAQGYLKRKDARDEGLIYAQRSTIYLNPSNDSLKCFWGYTPVHLYTCPPCALNAHFYAFFFHNRNFSIPGFICREKRRTGAHPNWAPEKAEELRL